MLGFARTAVLILSLVLLWTSIQDHALYPPDEGRYATVSLQMAEGGSWLVPVYEGHPHLTKPPLTYWLQALSIEVFGKTAFAVRVPSVAAASVVILILFWFGQKVATKRISAIAVGTLTISPLFVFVGRLAITDSLLNAAWFGTLVFGYLAVEEADSKRSRKWAALLWTAQALGWFVKGPIAALPILVLVIWLVISGRVRKVARWRPWFGFPLALVPIFTWVILVIRFHPDAWSIWYDETVSRATGSGDHVEPFWYYLPVFLAGLFPASALAPIAGWNTSLRGAWKECRSGSLRAMLGLAVFLPFVAFSLISGKLATYILPLCAPLALLVAIHLDARIKSTSSEDVLSESVETGTQVTASNASHSGARVAVRISKLRRILRLRPANFGGVVSGAILIAVAAFGAALVIDRSRWMLALPFIFLALVVVGLHLVWRRSASRRSMVLLLTWAAFLSAYFWAFEVEDDVLATMGGNRASEAVQLALDGHNAPVYTYGFRDPTLSFYLDSPVSELKGAKAIENLLDQSVEGDVWLLLVDGDAWERLKRKYPEITGRLAVSTEFKTWPNRQVIGARAGASLNEN